MDYPYPPNYQPRFEGDLAESELVWRKYYYFLLQRGYQLRPRYKPGWQGSWLTNGKNAVYCEDWVITTPRHVMDAKRVSDGVNVVLKLVHTDRDEIPIGLYLSSAFLRSDPRNHCVPILDVVPMPNNDIFAFIVMPLLRCFDHPYFKRKIECFEAFYQMLEGIEFMHEHNVAHRDACLLNFCMDATKLIPKGFHFGRPLTYDGIHYISRKHKSRKAVGPLKYYWIDFDLSIRFPNFEERHLVVGKFSQEKDVPELSWDVPYDPFKVDIFQVGKTIKRICEDYEGLEIFQPFIEYLTQQDPKLRPTASEALLKLERLMKSLSRGKLNGLVVHRSHGFNPGRQRSRLKRKKISAWKKRNLGNILSWINNKKNLNNEESLV